MGLTPGTRIGSYEITAQIGVGGMGEVYRATDTNLKRQVAIKVLPESFADDVERLARFQREAEALAALNHPNIAQIHGLERSGGTTALVMELVEGRTLETRIAEGPIPLQEALGIAAQMAAALDAAHRKGITHRDLKPANVQLTRSGVKLLDFGLAKVQRPVELSGETVTRALTGTGTILGTLNYMSPEQLQGRDADARSDIFALGLVLHEMITGTRVFDGSSPASVIAAILERPAPMLEPEILHRIVSTCLAKDPDDRFQTARDLKRAIEWSGHVGLGTPVTQGPTLARTGTYALALVAVVTLTGLVTWRAASPGESQGGPDLSLSIAPPAATGIQSVGESFISKPLVAPDGSAVLYRDREGGLGAPYRLRRLDTLQAEEVRIPSPDRGSSGAWSPDSSLLTFDSGGALWSMRLPNGAPERITSTVGPVAGISWSDAGALLFAAVTSRYQLFVVPPGGGEAQPLTLPGLAEGNYFYPEFIPGTNEFLVGVELPGNRDVEIYLATLEGDSAVDPVRVMTNRTIVHYTPARGGQVLFVRNDVLYSQGLDLESRQLSGQPQEVLTGVASIPGFHSGLFSVSRDGVLAWRPGTEVESNLVTFNRDGTVIGTSGPPTSLPLSVKLSPDEGRLLVATQTEQFLVEPNRPGQSVVSRSRNALTTLWAPDSEHLLVPATGRLSERPVSSGSEQEILQAAGLGRLEDISPDGKWILFTGGALTTSVHAVRLDESEPPQPVVDTGERVFNTRFSPDGRWITFEAYPATEGGEGIYVQPFPGPGLRRQISPRGIYPLWRKDGQEIVFLDQGQIWSIQVTTSGDEPSFSEPDPLFSVREPGGVVDIVPMAVTRDGTRFYIMQPVEQPDTDVIHVRTGWGRGE